MFKHITFTRTMCYGSCPVYSIDIYDDGIVKWNGICFVSSIGESEWVLTAKQVET